MAITLNVALRCVIEMLDEPCVSLLGLLLRLADGYKPLRLWVDMAWRIDNGLCVLTCLCGYYLM